MKAVNFILIASLFFGPILSFAGGVVGGGGGNTKPKEPASIDQIEKIVHNRKLQLRLVIKKEQQTFPRIQENPYDPTSWHDATEQDEKLYGGSTTIMDLLEKTPVEIRKSGPCFDKNGKAVDGSIYSSVTGAICISAFTIAPKTEKINALAETLALIMHELSHLLLGEAEEAGAQAFQQRILNKLYLRSDWYAERFIEDVWREARDIADLMEQIIKPLPAISGYKLLKTSTILEGRILNFGGFAGSPVYDVFDANEFAAFWLLRYRILNTVYFAQAFVEANPQGEANEFYYSKFGGHKQIPLKDFTKRGAPASVENEPILRIDNLAELKTQLIEQLKEVQAMMRQIESLKQVQ